MALRPKLEFYRFSLNHKDEEMKTFFDFAKEELTRKRHLTEEEALEILFKNFIKNLSGEYAKNKSQKKEIKLVNNRINKYLDHKPKFDSRDYTIYGVINGGPFDRDGIISNMNDSEDIISLGRNKSILRYYYFLLYIPLDHHEGCFIIQSHSKEETITSIFKNYIANIFKGSNYNKAIMEVYSPKSFQDEFKNNAALGCFTFKTSILDTKPTEKGVKDFFAEYDIRIEAIPKNKNVPITGVNKIRAVLAEKIYGDKQNSKELDNFEESRVLVRNTVNNSTRTFEWSNKDSDFIPVVYLDERIHAKNDDGTLCFKAVEQFCHTIFKDEILQEISPDLYVTKVK